ncbi:MAG: PHP domain-containing protein [Verrucomicrobiae bacterium]|nr:PHP domain-containing protein [Verrucomicrobiae bacterium]
MKADLHVHTHFSDGTDAPLAVFRRAAVLGYDILGIADHDTTQGIEESRDAAQQFGIRLIPSVEISAIWENREIHLLGYFPPESPPGQGWSHPELLAHLSLHAQLRRDRVQNILDKLQTLGVNLALEDVRRQTTGRGTMGRPHIAAALLARQWVDSHDQAFDQFLKRGRPAWVERPMADGVNIIDLIHRAGGLAILAHPGLLPGGYFPTKLIRFGLDGLEVYHSRHNASHSDRFLALARRHDLLVTAGSDCHGALKGEPLLGRIRLTGDDLKRFLKRLG